MTELDLETIAYIIIALLGLVSLPVGIAIGKRRRRQKLRRKGVKVYGH